LEVGGFDTRIKQPGGEDPCLSASIRARGYRLVFEPGATVLHEYRESITDFVRTFYRYGKGCAYVKGTEELVLSRLTGRTIWSVLAPAWESYAKARRPIRERAVFLALHAVQRVSYRAGWVAGQRELTALQGSDASTGPL
jgi:hypothetical protein